MSQWYNLNSDNSSASVGIGQYDSQPPTANGGVVVNNNLFFQIGYPQKIFFELWFFGSCYKQLAKQKEMI